MYEYLRVCRRYHALSPYESPLLEVDLRRDVDKAMVVSWKRVVKKFIEKRKWMGKRRHPAHRA